MQVTILCKATAFIIQSSFTLSVSYCCTKHPWDTVRFIILVHLTVETEINCKPYSSVGKAIRGNIYQKWSKTKFICGLNNYTHECLKRHSDYKPWILVYVFWRPAERKQVIVSHIQKSGSEHPTELTNHKTMTWAPTQCFNAKRETETDLTMVVKENKSNSKRRGSQLNRICDA